MSNLPLSSVGFWGQTLRGKETNPASIMARSDTSSVKNSTTRREKTLRSTSWRDESKREE